jgi:RNA polymerase sigma-70 factor (ECF subfamily)
MLFDSQKKLDAARQGDEEAKGELLIRFRPYLNVIAQRLLDDRVQGRLDFSDIVQATFFEASRDFGQFRGDTVESFLAWLRHILRNNVSTAHQEHLATQKRSARREVHLGKSVFTDGSHVEMANILPAETSTPSQRVMKNEAAGILAACMERLPNTQREAIRMRYLEGMALKEISERMGKSEMAIAGLLKRGLQGLRQEMQAIQTGLSSLM